MRSRARRCALLAAAGEIDVLVANAALPASGRLDGFSQEEIGRALRVNLESPMRMARELVPAWTARGSGHIVFVSSLSGKAATARASLYCATKFGLRGFALACARTCAGPASASRWSCRGSSATPGCSPTPTPPRRRSWAPRRPAQVGAGVVRAIERDRAEVAVAPLRARALSAIAANAPELAGRVAGGTATKVADEVAAGQTDKR